LDLCVIQNKVRFVCALENGQLQIPIEQLSAVVAVYTIKLDQL
jgi:hypothetical protein